MVNFFFFQAEDGIRDLYVTGVQTCALPISRIRAQGSDAKGRGSAQAKSTFRLEPSASGSKVLVHTDLSLSGAVAQYGRGVGMIQATASAIMNQFANNLK